MFQTAAGVTVPYPEKLNEQYLRDGNTITANLSFEKLSDFIHAFYAELDEPLFLAVHPDAEADEVWYLDGMTKKQLTMILDGYGLLYQDAAFAIGYRRGAFRAEVQGSVSLHPAKRRFEAARAVRGSDRAP